MLTNTEIYRRAIEANPKCAVPGLVYSQGYWWDQNSSSPYSDRLFTIVVTDFWTEMLPHDHGIIKYPSKTGKNVHFVVRHNILEKDPYESVRELASGPIRFHALAEQFAPGSTKETT